MKYLPYQANTATGDSFDLSFPLHDDTGSAVRVAQLISVVLETIDKDIAAMGETSNGDVLQAVAMALAIRARMIHAPTPVVRQLSVELVESALAAAAASERQTVPSGNA